MGYTPSGYVIYFDYAALIIMSVLLICYHLMKHLRSVQNRVLWGIIYSHYIVIIMDFLNVMGEEVLFLRQTPFLYITHTIYYFMHILTIFCFFLYCSFLVNHFAKESKGTRVLMALPIVIAYAMLLLNAWTGWIFRVDGGAGYSRGSLVIVFYVVGTFYIIATTYLIIRYRQSLTKVQFLVTFIYLLISVTGVVLQFAYPKFLVESFGITIAILILFFTTAKFTDYYDEFYQVLNKRAFLSIIESDINWIQPFL